MNKTKQSTQLLTAKALSEMLSTSVRSVWRYRSSGRLPETVKIAGAIRWRQSDIDEWIALGCPNKSEFETMKQARGEK